MLNKGDKIGIVCCSNGLPDTKREQIHELLKQLKAMGLSSQVTSYLYRKNSYMGGTAPERAKTLMNFYRDKEIKAIFDVSGGDIANELLDLLDYEVIRLNPKPFFGYSDLTVILNAIYKKTENPGYLYQIGNLAGRETESQKLWFHESLFLGSQGLFQFSHEFIQGTKMEGVVVGGNARCFLKLAGTPYMPDMKGKILFLEGRSGNSSKLATELCQLRHMGIFQEIRGILLGSFWEMERNGEKPGAGEIAVCQAKNKNLPIVQTHDIGHGPASKCLVIGGYISLSKGE